MRTPSTIPIKWNNPPRSHAPRKIKGAGDRCGEGRYELEPDFRAMIDFISCARYVLNQKYQAYFIVRIKGSKKDTALESELQNILNDLDALRNNENSDDYVFKPTDHAHRAAKFYIEKTYAKMGLAFPRPSFIPDGEGGIDIEWSVGDKELTLSCRANPNQENFLYVRMGDARYTELDLSSTKLHKHLKELTDA